MLMDLRQSALMVVDVQARLLPALHEGEAAVARVALLLRTARRLQVPALVTEQYPKGLGHTVPAVAAAAEDGPVCHKLHFAALREPAIAAQVRALGRSQIVVCGAETHVCVLQSAAELLRLGYQVFLVADACASRRESDKAAALGRLERLGAWVVTSEMVVFEWLERAGTGTFREVSAWIK